MLLESRLNERCTLVLDCESVGGIDKGALSVVADPDKVIPNAIHTVRGVAELFGEALVGESPHSPVAMRLEFTLKVDSNAVVQVARANEMGHFKVTLEWK